jgi:tungstate transport system ATP-binding protein
MALYELSNIGHDYGDRPVLAIDHLTIEPGTILGLTGPHGSGKSTLLRLLGFVERPSRGEIRFEGDPTQPFSDHIRARVILLPQNSYLLKRTAAQNVAYGLTLQASVGDSRRRIAEALAWVGLDGEHFGLRPWYALSGGEARRVALAARLALRPKVLLLDEPTASVDAFSAQLIKQAVTQARRQWETSLVIVSHDGEWLNDICDTQRHLFRGRITGTVQPTLVFGPWERLPDGRLAKRLTDGQLLKATAPISSDASDAVAALDPDDVTLYSFSSAPPIHLCRLQGTLLRLSLEKASGKVIGGVSVDDLLIHVRLPADGIRNGVYTPGERVWAAYPPDKVVWHAA